MTIQRIEPGKRLSQCVVDGDRVYLAGIIADNAKADVKGQAEEVLRKVDKLLAQAGTSKAKLLTALIFLPDMRNFQAMNAAWDAWVDPANTPARATVGAALANPELHVEIMVTAAK
jgi:enamine deaminase RidA (YjgF/YER057c/UK114 family)